MTLIHSPSEPVQRVLDRLDEMGKVVRWVTDQHMAQCPAHDDRNPSLAIREGNEGAILQCHAGCDTQAVVDAMGMTLADLFPPRAASNVTPLHPSPAPSLSWVRDYPYLDAQGEPAFKVSRYVQLDPAGAVIGKSFRQFHYEPGAGWRAGLNGSTPPLYRLPEVLAAVAAGEVVLVVEGEKDADAAEEAGLCATTSPMGAGKWRAEHTAALAGANVIIIADDDPPGRAHAAAVYAALDGVAKAVTTALPAQGCKDLSEQLDAGMDLTAIRPCAPGDLAGTGPIQDTPVEAAPHLALKPASEVTIVRVRWGWQDRMPIGELTLIPGREGVGKSLLLAWLAAELTKGTLPGEFFGSPRGVLYVASEDSWGYTVAPRLKAAGADLARVYRIDVLDGGRLVLPADCDALVPLALHVDAAALMLDPVISLINDKLSVNQASELRRALEPLRRTAEAAGVMVPALAHFNKTTDVDVLSKIPGSRAWAEVARAAFGVAEDREAGCYVASQIKNNLGRTNLPNMTYKIESVLIDAVDGQADVGRLVWTGVSDTGIEEVLGRKPDKRAREASETTNALVEFVLDQQYPIPLAEVYAAFPDVQQATVRQTLRRAVERGTLSNPLIGHYGPRKGL